MGSGCSGAGGCPGPGCEEPGVQLGLQWRGRLSERERGGSMERLTGRGNLRFAAAAEKGNTGSPSDLSHEKPKKSQHSSENVFSIGYDKSLFSLVVSPPEKTTCHHCGLFGSLRCSQCKQIYYCSVDCQKKDWPAHSVVCEPVKNNEGNLPAKTEKRVCLKEEMMLSFAVEVVLPDLGDCLDKIPLEIRSSLTPGSNAEGADSPRVSENHSEGSTEKSPEVLHYANSDAVCVSICIGDEFSGVVSSIQNPENFFCQQTQSGRQLAELQVALNEHCDKLPSSPDFRPAAGDVCCAQFTEDNCWYRAAVTACASEDTVLVGYLDYGNFEVLPLTRLRPMIPRLMDLPAQAIRCTLAGVKPPSGMWTSNAISYMSQLVKDKVLTIKVVAKESYSSVVELVDASVTPAINISRHLLARGCAAEESRAAAPAPALQGVEPAEEDTTNKRIFSWNKVTLNQTVDVMVCSVYSPGEFYCQISNNNELVALNLLNKSLSEYCKKTPPNVFKPENGEPCCAFFSDDGNWYRALVQTVTSHGTAEVCFVDYGNVAEVPLDKIRHISSSFLTLPAQGIKCWLSGIKPINSKWIPEATARFCMYAAGIKLQARVTSLSRFGAGVELTDNSTGHPKVINEILTSEKLAVKEVLQGKNNFPKKSIDKKETSLGHWKSIELAVDETMSVCVTEVASPDLFYAVPVQNKGKRRLQRLMLDLEGYCKSCKSRLFKPKVGEACCARFSGDGQWYRALVLKASQSVVKVLYADYGNTETLPFSKVLPIPNSYLTLPFQAITCSLAGIEKATWSPLLLDKLKEMLWNKHVTITVKGTNGNANIVTVVKHSENGSVNVVDKLVMEGLVKVCSAENLHAEHHGSGGETKCCCMELKEQVRFSPSSAHAFICAPGAHACSAVPKGLLQVTWSSVGVLGLGSFPPPRVCGGRTCGLGRRGEAAAAERNINPGAEEAGAKPPGAAGLRGTRSGSEE
ncbi:PREDICTED: tudor domain-containing protein 1-like, partial [Merops nubicus]|uniref:tudor domain-containing protein 1-like n=1 Tax=Merops nubicus TaxID=57421 RepID=UPI0004F04423